MIAMKLYKRFDDIQYWVYEPIKRPNYGKPQFPSQHHKSIKQAHYTPIQTLRDRLVQRLYV